MADSVQFLHKAVHSCRASRLVYSGWARSCDR